MSEYQFRSLKQNMTCFSHTKPHGWIQWKGTDVCVDIYCECGIHSHYDGDFMYFVKCPECGKIYEVNGHIQLIPVDKKNFKEEERCVQYPEI